MRIGIDARLYGPRVGGGGLGRYVEELVRSLEMLDRENEYIVFLRKENWDDYQPAAPNFRKVLAPWRWYTLAEQLHIPAVIREQKLDLIHYPHFNVPIFAKTPFVVTIHDLNLIEYPKVGITNLDPIRFWTKYLGYRFVLSHALRRAKKIIAVSETTRQAIAKRFPKTTNRLIAILLGFTEPQTQTTKPYTLNAKPYLLAVGNAYPHKNLHGLLAAFREVLHNKPKLTLVLTGPNDRFRDRVRHRANELGITDHVKITGFVSDAELNTLYHNATAYICPSLLEGFGFPGLEAQARGTPVLAADLPVLHETFGDAALYFDPKNLTSMATAINTILDHSELRSSLVLKGEENIKRFNWQNTAKQTLTIYRTSFSRKNLVK